MTLPIKYPPTIAPVLASTSSTDLVQRKGILKLWATSSNWSDNSPIANGSRILTSEQIDCGNYTYGAGTQHPRNHAYVNGGTSQTLTFKSSPFVAPVIFDGDANVVATICHTSTGSGVSTWTFSIEKNGTSLVSGSHLLTPGGINVVATLNKILDVPRTHFKVGDTMELSISQTMTATAKSFLEFDSMNRNITSYTPAGGHGDHPAITATANPTELALYMPMEIK